MARLQPHAFRPWHPLPLLLTLLLTLLCLPAQPALADGGVTFQDIAAGDSAGITYRRTPSASAAIMAEVRTRTTSGSEIPNLPLYPNGTPGVLLFDFDRDGDLDLYVTNGPGSANSLYSSQLVESGQLTFRDVAMEAHVALTDADTFGACFGDTDNDGDDDLLVLGNHEANHFFVNQGDGTFADMTAAAGLSGGARTSTSCSFGDVNNDGLLDVAVANAYDNWEHQLVILDTFAYNEHEQLFVNTGGNVFTDASATSGIEVLDLPAQFAGSAALSWAVSMVDYDLDGDADLIFGNDQENPLPPAAFGGFDLGLIRVFNNDGTGHFTDVSKAIGTARAGVWMGFSFGDLNCDGYLDLFGTNGGDYLTALAGLPLGTAPSQWFLGGAGGTFSDPGVGSLVATPFGWGTSMFDYDNDGDQDVIFHGGSDLVFSVDATNHGALLQNPGCSAQLVRDTTALAGSTDHSRRTVYGVAVGDLDGNGFDDIVSAASFNLPAEAPLFPYGFAFGSPFDADALIAPTFLPTPQDPSMVAWTGLEYLPGTLSVELNGGENGNRSVAVTLEGNAGLVNGATVNRSGIGAVVRFTPRGGATTMRPVVGGSSYGSQDSLTLTFGLGQEPWGNVDVLWPGGTRNRVYRVQAGERLVVPEVPCSYDANWPSFSSYLSCVQSALDELVDSGVLPRRQLRRFLASAARAYVESQP